MDCLNKKIMKEGIKLFFKPKCCECGERKPIAYTNSFSTMTNGQVALNYCFECNQKRIAVNKEIEEKDKKRWKPIIEEQEKQRRYEYLKREIELIELEEKAKILGIK